MSKIHFLPVKYGDSFVIECDKGENHGVVVVDGGPNGCGKILQAKLEEVGKASGLEEAVTPDLMVLTHYDDDHIGGLTQYVKSCKKEGKVPAREVWANCAKYVDTFAADDDLSTRSALQGVKLGVLLDMAAEGGGLSWRDDVTEGLEKAFPFADVEVVSPTERGRELAIGKQEIAMEGKDLAALTRSIVVVPTLEKLALDVPKPPSEKADAEVANAASIAFILRCDGLSVLMLGDCYPHNVVDYLRAKGYSEENPLQVDFVKVAHHGSRHNTSNELMDLVHCNHYLISTNGDKFGHPDREAFAHILCHPTRDRDEKVHLYFNCDMATLLAKSGSFLLEGEPAAYNFAIHESVSELPLAEDTPADAPAEIPDQVRNDTEADRNDAEADQNDGQDVRSGEVETEIPDQVRNDVENDAEEKPRKKRLCWLRRLFSGLRFNLDFSSKKK